MNILEVINHMFCNHTWEIKDKLKISPPIDSIKDVIRGKADLPFYLFEESVTTIMVCTKCGKVDKTTLRTETW
jgi:hypothetical protein